MAMVMAAVVVVAVVEHKPRRDGACVFTHRYAKREEGLDVGRD